MSLVPFESNAAFVAYSLAYTGPPLFCLPDLGETGKGVAMPIIAAAVLLGANDRAYERDPMSRSALAAKVDRMLSDSPPDSDPAPDSHDPTAERFAAYAEGVGDTLDAVETWALSNKPPHSILDWLVARRASAPKRGMTAAEVLARFDAWSRTSADTECVNSTQLVAKIGRELEGGTQ